MAQVGIEVHVDVNEQMVREVARSVWREQEEEIRAVVYEEVNGIPRATLADLLGFELSDTTPTWDAIFQAVDELMEVRRG